MDKGSLFWEFRLGLTFRNKSLSFNILTIKEKILLIISLDEKIMKNIQYSVMIKKKTLSKLGTEGNYLNSIMSYR